MLHVFNEGIALSYSDTITDIDLSQLRLDSLLANVQVIDTIGEATLKLALGIENGDFISIDPKFELTKSGYIKTRFLDDKTSVGNSLGFRFNSISTCSI